MRKNKSKVNKVAARKHFQSQGKLDGIHDGNEEKEEDERIKHKSKDNKETVLE